MQNVYTVSRGERCEGGSIVAVFASRESAVAYVKKTYLASGEFTPSTSANRWVGGCDYVVVEVWRIRS